MTSIDDILMTAMPAKGTAKAGAKGAHKSDDEQAFERAVTDLDKKPTHGKAMGHGQAKQAAGRLAAANEAVNDLVPAAGQGADQSLADEPEAPTGRDGRDLQSGTSPAKGRGQSGLLGAAWRMSDAMRRAGQVDAPNVKYQVESKAHWPADVPKAGTSADADAASLARAEKKAETAARSAAESAKLDGAKVDDAARPPAGKVSQTKGADELAGTSGDQATSSPTPVDGAGSIGAGETRQLFALLGVAAPQARTADKVKGFEDQEAGEAAHKATLELHAAHGNGRSEAAHAEKAAKAGRNEPQATADRLFRFATADGRASALSVSSGTDGAKLGASGETSSARAETVTVLEARRYLGLSSTANTQAVTSAIAGSAELAQTLKGANDPLQSGAGRVVNTLRIQMHPIDLGTVTATLRLKDDALQVELRVETGEAYRQLSDDQDAMIRALKAQGFAVDQISFVLAPAASGDGGQGQPAPQGQNHSASGQPGRDAQNAFSSSGEGRQNEGSRNRQAPQEARSDLPGERAAAGRPGHQSGVYI